jgi:hypothetical protein
MFRSFLAVFVVFLPLVLSGGNMQQIQRITFIGNSITQAGNMPSYGWYGYWGVAASQADRDYVHRVQLGITARQGSIPEIQIINSDLHLIDTQTYTEVVTFAPDLIVVEMGDNASTELPQTAYDDAYNTIRNAAPNTRIIATGLWHGVMNDIREARIKVAALKNNIEFISITDLDTDANQVRSENRCSNYAVCWHPGDKGMQAIADRLLAVIYGDQTPGTIPIQKLYAPVVIK